MADDLRGKWKETGVGLGHAFRDLGKTIIKSGATAVQKADDWANSEDNAPNVTAEPNVKPANFCSNCGNALESGVKFCSNFETAV